MRIRCFVLLITALPLVACSGPDTGDPAPTAELSVSAAPTASGKPARTVDELAAMSPIDLMVNLGPDGWTARYNAGAGVALTPGNWAEVYELSEKEAQQEMAEAARAGQRGAATEEWRSEPSGPKVGYSTMRLTIRQFQSLARITSAWWHSLLEKGAAPPGVTLPAGMRIACGAPRDVSANHYAGAQYADCLVIVGDATVVYLSRIEPTAAAGAGAVAAITGWLAAVRAG